MSANIGKNVVFLAFIRQKYPNTGGGDTFAGIFKLHKLFQHFCTISYDGYISVDCFTFFFLFK